MWKLSNHFKKTKKISFMDHEDKEKYSNNIDYRFDLASEEITEVSHVCNCFTVIS